MNYYPRIISKINAGVETFVQQDFPKDTLSQMKELRRQEKFCDVTLMIEDTRVRAHRIVLASTIPYFHAMFTLEMAELRQKHITIEGIDPRTLTHLINFAYAGRIVISNKNVQELFCGASFLQLNAIKEACCSFMKSRLEPSNVIGVFRFADAMMCSTLVEASRRYIYSHFTEVSKCEEFLSLEKDQLMEIIARDDLHVDSEEQVFEACMSWIHKDEKLRKDFIPELMQWIRLPLISSHYLRENVAAEKLIEVSSPCRDLLDEAKDYHLFPERRIQIETFRTRPRCCIEVVGNIHAVGSHTSGDLYYITNKVPSRHHIKLYGSLDYVTLPEWFDEYTSTCVNNKGLFMISAKKGNHVSYLRDVTDANSLISFPDLPEFKHAAGVLCVNDTWLYVCGGRNYKKFRYSGACHRININNPTEWHQLPNLSMRVRNPLLVFFKGYVYVMGGLPTTRTVHRYDVSTNTYYQVVDELPYRNGFCDLDPRGCVVYQDKIVVFCREACLVYVNDRWIVFRDGKIMIGNEMNAIIYKNQLAACVWSVNRYSFMTYDLDRNSWKREINEIDDMFDTRHSFVL